MPGTDPMTPTPTTPATPAPALATATEPVPEPVPEPEPEAARTNRRQRRDGNRALVTPVGRAGLRATGARAPTDRADRRYSGFSGSSRHRGSGKR